MTTIFNTSDYAPPQGNVTQAELQQQISTRVAKSQLTQTGAALGVIQADAGGNVNALNINTNNVTLVSGGSIYMKNNANTNETIIQANDTGSNNILFNLPYVSGTGIAIDTFAVLNTQQSLTNKYLDDLNVVIVNDVDNTKQLGFSLVGTTTGKKLTVTGSQTTSQTLAIPNITATDTVATLGLAQTFGGAKTFSSSVLTSGLGGFGAGGIGLNSTPTILLNNPNHNVVVLGCGSTFNNGPTADAVTNIFSFSGANSIASAIQIGCDGVHTNIMGMDTLGNAIFGTDGSSIALRTGMNYNTSSGTLTTGTTQLAISSAATTITGNLGVGGNITQSTAASSISSGITGSITAGSGGITSNGGIACNGPLTTKHLMISQSSPPTATSTRGPVSLAANSSDNAGAVIITNNSIFSAGTGGTMCTVSYITAFPTTAFTVINQGAGPTPSGATYYVMFDQTGFSVGVTGTWPIGSYEFSYITIGI